MSYNIVLTARKGIGWVGERGDVEGVLAEEDARKVAVLAERSAAFELRTPFEARGPPAADPAAGTEKMPVDGRLLRVDVVWQPCVSRTESGSLKPSSPGVDADLPTG